MTQYVTKFEAGRNGAFYQDDAADAPAGWTLRYSPGDVVTRLPAPAGSFGWSSRRAAYPSGAGASTWSLIDADANRANVEVLTGGRALSFVYPGAIVVIAEASVIVRGSAAANTYYRFRLTIDASFPSIVVSKIIAGTSTTLSTVTPASGASLMWLRVRANGTSLQARAWARDAVEPTSWDVSITDSSITAAGYVGHMRGSHDFFSVGTNGDAAPKPRLLTAADTELCRGITSGQPVLCTLDFDVPAFTGSTSVAGRVTRNYSNLPYDTGAVQPMQGTVYSTRINKIPSVSREISEIGGGVAKVGGCDVAMANGDCSLDDLFRMSLFRQPATVRIGLPSWPWYDLLPYHQGVVQGVADNAGDLTVQLDGTLRELDADVTITTSAAGTTNADKPLPQQYGYSQNITPVLVDAANLVYQYNDGANRIVWDVRDRGVSLASPTTLTLIAFDAAADMLTTSTAHGRAVGDLLAFSSGLPAPLVSYSVYEIKAVPAADKFTLTATRGGTVIDLTGTSGAISATAAVRLYVLNGELGINAPTVGSIMLARQPVGQVTMDVSEQQTVFGPSSFPNYLSPKANFCRATGVAAAKFSIDHGTGSNAAQNLYLTDRRSRMSVLEDMAARGIPVTAARSGALSWRAIDFGTVAATLTEADCYGVPRLTKILQPSAGRVGIPNWTVQTPADLASSVSAADVAKWGKPQLALASALGVDYQWPVFWGGLSKDTSIYRDTMPDQSVGGIGSSISITSAGNGGFTTLNSAAGRARAAQVFELAVATKSFLLDPADVVSLTHRRHFFKDVVNEVDVSPERLATAIGPQNQPSRAVITKIVDDPASGRQTLTLYRPMPVLFPAS
jgi:hypothetical protein